MSEPSDPIWPRPKAEGKIPRPEHIDQGEEPRIDPVTVSLPEVIRRAREGVADIDGSISGAIERIDEFLAEEPDGGEAKEVVVEVPIPPSGAKSFKKNPLGEPSEVEQDVDDAFDKSFNL